MQVVPAKSLNQEAELVATAEHGLLVDTFSINHKKISFSSYV